MLQGATGRKVGRKREATTCSFDLVAMFGGLRTGEIRALEWKDVRFDRRLIHVQRSVKGPLKDKQSRFVPINDALLGVLKAWRLRSPTGNGLLFPPSGQGRPGRNKKEQTLGGHLRAALTACELPTMSWYQATRHTFASHYIMDGRPLETLREILGHCSVVVTERYAHLRPGTFVPTATMGRMLLLDKLHEQQEPRAATMQLLDALLADDNLRATVRDVLQAESPRALEKARRRVEKERAA